jgi:hypothetical protein
MNQPREVVEKYLIILRHINTVETKRQLFNMKLKHVEFVKNNMNSNDDKDMIEIVSKVQKCTNEEALDIPIIEFFGLLNSIRKQLEIIMTAEENALVSSKVNIKWEMVEGSQRMSKFGIYNTLDKLTHKKPHLYKLYMNMIYSEIFTILLKWKTEEEIQEEMNNIKTKTK